MPGKWGWCFKRNYCDGIALEKEADHHEDSDDESHYDYDNDNLSDSDLSQSEADSDDWNQLCHPIKLIYFIQQQPPSGVLENTGSKICS